MVIWIRKAIESLGHARSKVSEERVGIRVLWRQKGRYRVMAPAATQKRPVVAT